MVPPYAEVGVSQATHEDIPYYLRIRSTGLRQESYYWITPP